MARTANLHGVLESLPPIPALHGAKTTPRRATTIAILAKKSEEVEEHHLQTTRRAALGLASIALGANFGTGNSLAEGNGLWTDGPLPIPSVYNKINNEETGTRSFLKIGIYIADIGTKGRAFRLRKYAFDLLGLGDLIGQDAWNYVRKYLRLKSTIMYYDFDKVISAASVNDKQPLMDLANRLFNNVEKLEDAVKKHNLPETESCYQDTTAILQEVMSRMA
ncbi:hypothetical protein RJ640_004608 [Escallonia rubra]|uniref:Photosynthetic NDH subcomplex L 3 n=1 Tax=Escallonia rubra TaxID=112253 RepID=A0AA88R8Y5_9ASTE|nr:hypothetical protein RJ640_004608 [Escallonia rubra]